MFKLNTTSGYLHNEDHGGENTKEFKRVDEADLAAFKAGKKLKYCEQCFGKTRNTPTQGQGESEIELALATLPESDPTHLEERLRGTTVNADDAVPAGRHDLPIQPQPRQTPRMG